MLDSGMVGADEGVLMTESKQMELARMRNLSMQRKLHHRLQQLQHDCELSSSRLAVEQRYVHRALTDIQASQHGGGGPRRIRLPRGLSNKHIQMLQQQQEQENTKSITLDQFDKKLGLFHGKRAFYRCALLDYRSNPSRSLQKFMPEDIEERCRRTNVHFNLYQKADDKDEALQREPTLLTMLPSTRAYLPALSEEGHAAEPAYSVRSGALLPAHRTSPGNLPPAPGVERLPSLVHNTAPHNEDSHIHRMPLNHKANTVPEMGKLPLISIEEAPSAGEHSSQAGTAHQPDPAQTHLVKDPEDQIHLVMDPEDQTHLVMDPEDQIHLVKDSEDQTQLGKMEDMVMNRGQVSKYHAYRPNATKMPKASNVQGPRARSPMPRGNTVT